MSFYHINTTWTDKNGIINNDTYIEIVSTAVEALANVEKLMKQAEGKWQITLFHKVE